MKIKFEIKLTASRALLTVLGALVGLQASAVNENQQEKPVFVPDGSPREITKSEFEAEKASQGPAEVAAQPLIEKKTRTRKIAESVPVPEKIVAPAPEPKTETQETEDVPAAAPAAEVTLTVDDIRNYAGKLIQATPTLRDKVMAVLTAKGASKFSEAKPEDYADILAEFKKLG